MSIKGFDKANIRLEVRESKHHDSIYHFNSVDRIFIHNYSMQNFIEASKKKNLYLAETSINSEALLKDLQIPSQVVHQMNKAGMTDLLQANLWMSSSQHTPKVLFYISCGTKMPSASGIDPNCRSTPFIMILITISCCRSGSTK